jgi:hypothetical protein
VQKSAEFYRRHGPGPGSERYSYDSIRNSEVRALVQPGNEKLMVFPHPSMATGFQPAVVGKEPEGKPCANCQHLFVARLTCGGCRSVSVSNGQLCHALYLRVCSILQLVAVCLLTCRAVS